VVGEKKTPQVSSLFIFPHNNSLVEQRKKHLPKQGSGAVMVDPEHSSD
jgi:hypothetical protein